MYIEASNPVVKSFIQNFLTKDISDLAPEYAYDYDNVVYQVQGNSEACKVYFSCKTNCPKQIFAHGGAAVLEELYKEFICPQNDYVEGFDVTLAIDTKSFPKTKKVKKGTDEETANKIR